MTIHGYPCRCTGTSETAFWDHPIAVQKEFGLMSPHQSVQWFPERIAVPNQKLKNMSKKQGFTFSYSWLVSIQTLAEVRSSLEALVITFLNIELRIAFPLLLVLLLLLLLLLLFVCIVSLANHTLFFPTLWLTRPHKMPLSGITNLQHGMEPA